MRHFMKKVSLLLLALMFCSFIFAIEPTLEEINEATMLYEKAGTEFDTAQSLYTTANEIMGKVDQGNNVPIEKIDYASAQFEQASGIFSQAEIDYRKANSILSFMDEQPPAQPQPLPQIVNVKQEKYLLYASHFDFDKSYLQEKEKTEIESMILTLDDPAGVTYFIGGHTDNIGPRDYNSILSIQRAKSIVNYLISLGIDPNNIEIKGYGEDVPIADNETDSGRAENRRTEIYVK